MFKKAFSLYLEKSGKDGAFIHAAFAILALIVDPALALGMVTTSIKSARITAPLAIAWAAWQCYWALGPTFFAKYTNEPTFDPTSPVVIAIVAFVAGILVRQIVDGRFSRNAAVATAVVALVMVTQGRGGLDELNARYVVGTSAAEAHSESLWRVYAKVNEIQKQKGFNSPEALGASYVWNSELWPTFDMVGTPDYNSFLAYRKQKQSDADLLKMMSSMGRSSEWAEMVEKRYSDPSWPENYKSK